MIDDNLDFTLLDDGTLDTVVEVTCMRCGKTWEERFDGECASYYRNPETGAMVDLLAFVEGFDIYCPCSED